ncbi:MAG: hypothetical protein D4R84_13245, partial [Rhodocyclaceae bacterium]
MISFTSVQLDAWLAAFMFPLARVLALMASAPVFSSEGVPMQTRLVIGLAIGLGLAPALPPMPAFDSGVPVPAFDSGVIGAESAPLPVSRITPCATRCEPSTDDSRL